MVWATMNAQENPAAYDSTLAMQLGADDYGMRTYALVMLTTGPATDLEKETRDSLFRGHMQNINRLAEEGSLVLAGPFTKHEKYRGMFIFKVDDAEAAEALVLSDPAVAGGALGYEILMWYGSAAVQQVNELHRSIQKVKF